MILALKIEVLKQIINDPNFKDDIIELNILLDKYVKLYELINEKKEEKDIDYTKLSGKEKYDLLLKNINENNILNVITLFSHQVDIKDNLTDSNFIFTTCVKNGNIKIMEELINYAKTNYHYNWKTWTNDALLQAVIYNQSEMIDYLITCQRVDIHFNRDSALFEAIITTKDIKLVKCLIEKYGAYIGENWGDYSYKQVLQSDKEIVEYLKNWKVKAIEYVINSETCDKYNTILYIMSLLDIK